MLVEEDVRGVPVISTAILLRVEFSGTTSFSSHFGGPMFVTVKEAETGLIA